MQLVNICKQATDGILAFENDYLDLLCTKLLHIKHPSFQDMNKVIANALANILLPSHAASNGARNLGSIVEHLCCHPGYKMLTSLTVPQIPQQSIAFSSHTWNGILKHLYQMSITQAKLDENINWNFKPTAQNVSKSVASMLFLRGTQLDQANESIAMFKNTLLYPSWSMYEN